MSDLADVINEAVERSHEEGDGAGDGGDGGAAEPGGKRPRMSLNSVVALSVAVAATFVALCNVKDGNIVQAMQQAQANGVDAWAYYQAKGTKLNIAEAALDAVHLQRDTAANLTPQTRALLDAKIAEYGEKIRHYEQEKEDIKRTAEGYQKEYDRLNVHDDQFDMAEATISIAIALLGVTALTQKRRLLYLALAFGGFGVVLGLAGFFGLAIHPDFLARFLG
jgi:hypothetical protein